MDHILLRCPQSAGNFIWPLVQEMCRAKNIDWPPSFEILTILASPLATFRSRSGSLREGATRFFQIAITEAAFLIRNVKDCPDHEPERLISEPEATSALAQVMNEQLRDDRAMTNRQKFKSKALRHECVLETWSGILQDESGLPPDWIYGQSGVSVGTTPCRLNGINR